MTRPLPPLQSWTSAFVGAMIGFGATVALIVQATQALGASVEQAGSAVTALCLGIAGAGAILSFRLKIPVVLAWSTPGAALLATTAPGMSWPAAVGAFIVSAVLTICLGVIPALGKLAERIPASVASAMLAGVLLPFCLALFKVGGSDPLLVAAVVVVFLAARQRVPLYALLLVLAVGAGLPILRGDLGALPPGATLGHLSPTMPSFDMSIILSIGVPLFLVTLVAQNLPGLVVLRTADYRPAPRPLLSGVGLASLVMAPFGAHAVNLAAITAAICTGEDAHPDRDRRWTVGMIYAGFYVLLAAFSPLLVRFFLALPHSVIAALTGVALIPALVGSIETSLRTVDERDAAIVTFLTAASGLTLLQLGSAFWGLVLGFVALGIKAALRKR